MALTHNYLVSNLFVLVGRDVDIEEHRLGKNPASTLHPAGSGSKPFPIYIS